MYFNANKFMEMTGCSLTQAIIIAENYLIDKHPQTAAWVRNWNKNAEDLHVSDFMTEDPDDNVDYILLVEEEEAV